jgi:hypothetical protein
LEAPPRIHGGLVSARSVVQNCGVVSSSLASNIARKHQNTPFSLQHAPGSMSTCQWTYCTHAGPQQDTSVAALQERICQSPPEHYSRGGARPLLYASVLAMTLQYRRLVAFLHTDRSASAFRDVAAVLAVALFTTGLLRVQQGDSGADAALSPGEAPEDNISAAAQARAVCPMLRTYHFTVQANQIRHQTCSHRW